MRQLPGAALILSMLVGILSATPQTASSQGDPWLMKAHDVHRTGQSASAGPIALDQQRSWSVPATEGLMINMGASVDNHGVYFGTWGLQRAVDTADRTTWNKYDGSLFGFDRSGEPLWGDGEIELDVVQRCYTYPGREKISQDVLFCGGFNNLHVTFYNGTVEGTPAIDPGRGVMYIGRGDGKLYAIDQSSGAIRWRFTTFNPLVPDDPDGGGEVVTGPLYDADGDVWFATWGEGPYETNAIYSVSPDGALQFRYPTDSSLPHRFFASPAMSRDSTTIYFATFTTQEEDPSAGYLYAVTNEPGAVPRLKWIEPLTHEGAPVYFTTMAVDASGVINLGGYVVSEDSPEPILLRLRDTGEGTVSVSEPILFGDGTQFVGGIAVREVGGTVEHLVVTTSNVGAPLTNYLKEGNLYIIENGAVAASFDPSVELPEATGSMNSPAIDRDGRIYVGVRGHFRGLFVPQPVTGHYLALEYSGVPKELSLLWSMPAEGQVEWTHPAIGPDGGVYAGSAVGGSGDSIFQAVHRSGAAVPKATPLFFGMFGPTSAIAGSDGPEGLIVLPNPFSDQLRIQTEPETEVIIYDILGRLVHRLKADEAGRANWNGRTKDGKGIHPGSYLIHTVSGTALATRK